jgi:hypothetical protein
MRHADSSEPAADGGGRGDHDAVLTQLGLDLHQWDVSLGIEETVHECLMRLKDGTTVPAKAGRSRAATLPKPSHQFDSCGGAHLKA